MLSKVELNPGSASQNTPWPLRSKGISFDLTDRVGKQQFPK